MVWTVADPFLLTSTPVCGLVRWPCRCGRPAGHRACGVAQTPASDGCSSVTEVQTTDCAPLTIYYDIQTTAATAGGGCACITGGVVAIRNPEEDIYKVI